MRILFFDTSCEFILIGIYTLIDFAINENYFYAGYHPREASYRLIPDIRNGLMSINCNKPDLIVCCKGPGSFTGIRLSVTTARNLSQIWEIPTFGIDTIELYSHFYFEKLKSPVITAIDGKQKKVFAGFYNGENYKGTFDVFPSDFPDLFKDEIQSAIIISDTNLVLPKPNLLDNLPNPMPILKNKISTIQTLTFERNNFSSLYPNYMRESYAHK